jgi:Domain of Unknown Function with PDB structure (DUF3861)
MRSTGPRSTSNAATDGDELLAILEKTRSRGILDANDSAAMAIGLKLLSEIAIEHRNEPPFDELRAPQGAFIRKLKAIPTTTEMSFPEADLVGRKPSHNGHSQRGL